jgi:hypothetical protein
MSIVIIRRRVHTEFGPLTSTLAMTGKVIWNSVLSIGKLGKIKPLEIKASNSWLERVSDGLSCIR